jgi:hypothetical protein
VSRPGRDALSPESRQFIEEIAKAYRQSSPNASNQTIAEAVHAEIRRRMQAGDARAVRLGNEILAWEVAHGVTDAGPLDPRVN